MPFKITTRRKFRIIWGITVTAFGKFRMNVDYNCNFLVPLTSVQLQRRTLSGNFKNFLQRQSYDIIVF